MILRAHDNLAQQYLLSILIMRQVKPYIVNKTVKKEYRLFFREKHNILKTYYV